jgi:photosystem II stability/assembly factor-like uncharacterized protein
LDFQVDQSVAHSFSASTSNLSVRTIVIDLVSPQTLYIGTYQSGVYKSLNGGLSWNASGMARKPIYSLVIDPLDSSHILAGTSGDKGSLFASVDAGSSWLNVNSGLGGRNVYALLFDPNVSSKLYAGTNDGLFIGIDGGNHWVRAGFEGLKVYALAIDRSSSEIVLVGASDGFYFSKDGGITWEQENTGLVNTVVQSITVDELSTKRYLGTDGSGSYRWNVSVP